MSPSITLEEHYVFHEVIDKKISEAEYSQFPPHIMTKLLDLDSKRIADMNSGNVTLQVLSHGPLNGSPELCTSANTSLSESISKHPTRLAAFAMLPMSDPQAAATELSRCVKDLKFLGALIDNHLDGRFYDDSFFWPIFAKAEELDVPIYIHPTFASEEMFAHYKGNYPISAAGALSAFGWGWHTETGLHILRLYASGLFDKYPKLKIVIGHMGEMLPFQLDRIISQVARWAGPKERGLRGVWRENIWVTTSGMFSLAPLKCLLDVSERDHVLYSVDYPFSGNEKGAQFLELVRGSGLLSEEETEGFEYRNAEKLLGIKVKEDK